MNWEALGAIGEIVGAAGVIVTLGYLAIQIRRNTRTVQSAAREEILRDMHGFISLVASDSDTADFYERGLADSCDFSRAERLRFSLLLTRFFYSFGRMYDLRRDRSLDLESWEAHREILRWMIKQPGVKRWWSNARSQIPASFAEFVDGEMG